MIVQSIPIHHCLSEQLLINMFISEQYYQFINPLRFIRFDSCMNGGMTQFYDLCNRISVVSERWEGHSERLSAMEARPFTVEKISAASGTG